MDFYYQGAWRMDWGLGNPNKTAVFIACLMLAVWLAPCFWRRGFWFALPVSTALSYCLVHTYSRGGMLALLAGIAILLAWASRPWPKTRAVAATGAIWIVALFIVCAKAESRYGQGLFSDDQSINSRLVVWNISRRCWLPLPGAGDGAGQATPTRNGTSRPINRFITSTCSIAILPGWRKGVGCFRCSI